MEAEKGPKKEKENNHRPHATMNFWVVAVSFFEGVLLPQRIPSVFWYIAPLFSPNSLLLGFLMQLEIWPPWCWLVWSVSWALKWSCLPLSPVVSLYAGGGCWLVWPPSWALKWSCLPLSPVVSLHVGGGCWLVWPHLEQKYSEIKITGFNLNLLTVNCLGSTLV